MKGGEGGDRRDFLKAAVALAATTMVSTRLGAAPTSTIRRAIPSSNEQLPVVGLGTSRTLNVSREEAINLTGVVQTFFDKGGSVIDSSPMYGAAEEAIGVILPRVKNRGVLFSATKVWTDGKEAGVAQMEASRKLWGIERFDLIQIHNLRDWQVHIETLKDWKAKGRVRYLGITTSHGRQHDELEAALKKERFDFVQFTYNVLDREVEKRLLPLAAERGTAVLINRPFQKADLFAKVKGKALPDWAKEIDCQSWAQFFLKWVIGHPQVTCVIPATAKVHHMADNMGAGIGRLPDAAMRKRMADYIGTL